MTQFPFKDQIVEEIKLNSLRERKIYLIEEFDRESTFKVIRALDKITSIDVREGKKPEESEPIWLLIDSYGGCLHSCFNLISTIRKYQNKGWRINTVAMRTMSAGFFTFMTGTKRYVLELASLMVHDQRAFEYGYKTMRDKRIELAEWEKEWARLKKLVIEYTDITEEELEWHVERRLDWNMDAEEAIEKNVADVIDDIVW